MVELPPHLLCRICGERPIIWHAYYSDREHFICDDASCEARVVHYRDNDHSYDRDMIIMDNLAHGGFKTIPYVEPDDGRTASSGEE